MVNISLGNFWYVDDTLEQPQGTWLRFINKDNLWSIEKFELQSYSWIKADVDVFLKEYLEKNNELWKLLSVFDQTNNTPVCLATNGEDMISIQTNHNGIIQAFKIDIVNSQIVRTPLHSQTENFPDLEPLKYKIKMKFLKIRTY